MMIKLINEIKHLTGGIQYTTTSEARAVAEKCCEVACKALWKSFENKECLSPFEAEEAIRKAFGGKK